MTVVDASVVVEVLLGTSAGRAAEGRLFDRRAELHAPHLLDVEVAAALLDFPLCAAALMLQ